MRGIAAFLAAVMMLPTAAFADGETPTETPDEINQISDEEQTQPTPVTSIQLSADKNLIYAGGENNKATLTLTADGDIDESKITWNCLESNVTLSKNGKTCVVTGNSKGTANIVAMYGLTVVSDPIAIEVETKAISDFKVETNKKLDTHYYTGQSFEKDGIEVYIKYNDKNEWVKTDDYTISPSGAFTTAGKNIDVTIGHSGIDKTHVIKVDVEQIEVESVTIVEPKNNAEVAKGKSIDSVTVKVIYNNEDDEEITMTKTDAKGITLSGYTLGTAINADTPITATYGGKASAPILIKVKAAAALESITVKQTESAKTEYNVGDKFSYNGLSIKATYSDATTKSITNVANLKFSPSTFDKAGNSIPVTITYTENGVSKDDVIYVKVIEKLKITGLDNDTDEYELKDSSDITVKIGDKLNDDVYWYDIFDEVRIIVDGKNKLIDSKSDLEDYPGVELLLKVYSKTSNSTVIESKDIGSDGKVRLQLYVKNGTETITSTSYSIREYIPVKSAECTVSIYSGTYITSTYLEASKVFDDFKDALDALKDERELEEVFDVTLGSKYTIRIKFGEDQELSSSYEFEPDYENAIYIDLNGCELKLPSDWIVYDDCEDLVVTVTNTNKDDYGKLVYRDKSVSLIVAEGSTLEFSEDNIPMDSDAAVTMTIYRSSSSSTVIDEKVYDDLEEALEALEKQDDVVEAFEISSAYKNSFVAKIKLGEDEDQDITDFTFAPDYDTTVSIDLNGNKLELDSDWIDYEDCEDLVVKINNTHADTKATLTYDDKDISLTIAKGDSALEFKEDEIPGIYDISIGSMTNGKATMSKDTVGHGGSVKFTITPNSGYAIDTVKINSKTVSASNYSVDSKGVGTYELKDIMGDAKLDVTFKKASATTTTPEKEESKPSSSTTNWTNPFTDVSANAQYYDAVAFVCSNGLFNGMTATKFEPTTTMTRAMFVTVLGRLAGVDPMRYSGTSFTDVSKTDQQISWAAPYIEWAVQNGITQGTGNGKFSPNDPITHQQMYLFMYRYAMYVENMTPSIGNVTLPTSISDRNQIADWALDGVKFASVNNILITSGGKLTPTENALRCELAMLLHGFCVKVLDYNG